MSSNLVADVKEEAVKMEKKVSKASHDYKGFVAGVFSGIAKLSGLSHRPMFLSHLLIWIYSRPPLRHDQSASSDNGLDSFQRPLAMPPSNSSQ